MEDDLSAFESRVQEMETACQAWKEIHNKLLARLEKIRSQLH
jgi:hypothetical protein